MLELTRIHGWRTAMQDNLIQLRLRTFEWGQLDCTLFCGMHVKAITGVDINAPFVGQYHDADSALAFLKSQGHDSLKAFMGANFPEVKPSRAVVGDLFLLEGTEGIGQALGICEGANVSMMTPDGIGRLPRTYKNIVAAYQVGLTHA